MSSDLTEQFREQLGPELEYLADGLAPAVTRLVSAAVEQSARQAEEETNRAKAAEERTSTVMTAFEAKHPDWKAHEPAMLALTERIQPTKGMTEADWLDHLYETVRHDTRKKERDSKIEAGVKAALADAEPDRERAQSPRSFEECFRAAQRGEAFDVDHPAETPPARDHPAARRAPLTFQDAYAAAKRGQRVED